MHKFKALLLACALLLLPASALADTPVALSNGDFEQIGIADGLPLDWYAEAWITGEDAYRIQRLTDENGAPCVQIAAPEENDVRLCQTIPVAENGYRISCRAAYPGRIRRGAGQRIRSGLVGPQDVVGTSNGWQQVELVGKTGADQEKWPSASGWGLWRPLAARPGSTNVEVVSWTACPLGRLPRTSARPPHPNPPKRPIM